MKRCINMGKPTSSSSFFFYSFLSFSLILSFLLSLFPSLSLLVSLSLSMAAYWQSTTQQLLSLNIMLCTLKTFKYVRSVKWKWNNRRDGEETEKRKGKRRETKEMGLGNAQLTALCAQCLCARVVLCVCTEYQVHPSAACHAYQQR